MGIGQAVKFKQGTQEQYDVAKTNQTLLENALYFTTDTHRLFLGEYELSTSLKVTGVYDGSGNAFPSGHNQTDYATITDNLQTGEIKLGSAAGLNVLTQFGPGEYTSPSSYGNKYLPTAHAVSDLVNDSGWLHFIDDVKGNPNFIVSILETWKNQQEGWIYRWTGPTATVPKKYIAVPGSSSEAPADEQLHNGDFVLLLKSFWEEEDPENPGETITTFDKCKVMLIHTHAITEERVRQIVEELMRSGSLVYHGTIGTNDGDAAAADLFKTNTTAEAGDLYKANDNITVLPAQYSSDNTEHTLKQGETVFYLGNDLWEYIPSVTSIRYLAPGDTPSGSLPGNLTWLPQSGEIILGKAANLDYITGMTDYQDASTDNTSMPTTAAVYDFVNSKIAEGAPPIQVITVEMTTGSNAQNLTGQITTDIFTKMQKTNLFVLNVQGTNTQRMNTYSTSRPITLVITDYDNNTLINAPLVCRVTTPVRSDKITTMRAGYYLCYYNNDNVYMTTVDRLLQGSSQQLRDSMSIVIQGPNQEALFNIALPHFNKAPFAGADGFAGVVPGPGYNDGNKFLKGDGTWSTVQLTPYGTASTSQTGTYTDSSSESYTVDQITVTSVDGIADNQYCVITFPNQYTISAKSEFLIFNNISASGFNVIVPQYRGKRLAAIPQGTWHWANTGTDNIFELIGTFGPDWNNLV